MGENKRVYTVEEIQAILSIGKNTAYALVKSGVFHSVKVGGQIENDSYRVCYE